MIDEIYYVLECDTPQFELKKKRKYYSFQVLQKKPHQIHWAWWIWNVALFLIVLNITELTSKLQNLKLAFEYTENIKYRHRIWYFEIWKIQSQLWIIISKQNMNIDCYHKKNLPAFFFQISMDCLLRACSFILTVLLFFNRWTWIKCDIHSSRRIDHKCSGTKSRTYRLFCSV